MFDRSIHFYHVFPERKSRILAISDIHGNLPLFKQLLETLRFEPEQDHLFLMGDLLEKGFYNLDTLHFIMDLAKHPHVHPMIGNCDVVCRNVLYDVRLDFLKRILQDRPGSVIHEMASGLGLHIDDESDMLALSKALRSHFMDELLFVDRLPHVIETPSMIFAHAGLTNEQTYGKDMGDIMVHDLFLKEAPSFQKYVVVGHLPVSEYRSGICCFNPLVDTQKHIISIDGGNAVKSAGQLNALIVEDGHMSFASCDALPHAVIKKAQHIANPQPFFITWHHRKVIRLQEGDKASYCYHPYSKKKLWIPHEFLSSGKDGLQADDYTDFQMPVNVGDVVSIIHRYPYGTLVKKQGLMGWVANSCL